MGALFSMLFFISCEIDRLEKAEPFAWREREMANNGYT